MALQPPYCLYLYIHAPGRSPSQGGEGRGEGIDHCCLVYLQSFSLDIGGNINDDEYDNHTTATDDDGAAAMGILDTEWNNRYMTATSCLVIGVHLETCCNIFAQ